MAISQTEDLVFRNFIIKKMNNGTKSFAYSCTGLYVLLTVMLPYVYHLCKHISIHYMYVLLDRHTRSILYITYENLLDLKTPVFVIGYRRYDP